MWRKKSIIVLQLLRLWIEAEGKLNPYCSDKKTGQTFVQGSIRCISWPLESWWRCPGALQHTVPSRPSGRTLPW